MTEPEKIDRPKTAKELLAITREFFGEFGEFGAPRIEQMRAWDVITALRGPDSMNDAAYRIKEKTTARIRGRVFGNDSAVHRDHRRGDR